MQDYQSDSRQRFDHERLDVYRVSLEFVILITKFLESNRHIERRFRDQLGRASLSIPLNIAEGNGKRSRRDRRRFLEIARGSAMESAAILDLLSATQTISPEEFTNAKRLLIRVVSMLTRMTSSAQKLERNPDLASKQ